MSDLQRWKDIATLGTRVTPEPEAMLALIQCAETLRFLSVDLKGNALDLAMIPLERLERAP